MSNGRTGATSVTKVTPERAKRFRKRQRAEEKQWAAKSGPVVIIKPANKDE